MTSEKNKADAFRIAVAEAQAMIAAAMPDFGTDEVELAAASGQILQQTISAERDQPPFDRATMDGIAVTAAALDNNVRKFRVMGVQAAGEAANTLTEVDACFEVMTGAVMPTGADTVIPVERVALDNGIAALEDDYEAQAGQFVHRRASDHAQGDVLLEPGCKINGPVMAVLTAAGSARVRIARQPRIAIVSTGDELVDVGAPIADFQIRSSNDRAIETCLQQRGYRNTTRTHLPDDPDELRQRIGALHKQNDALILSGGVSMGKYDYVPAILDQLGVRVVFHKILQRPGLPMWFGVSAAGKPVFALPGNPVSTIVCCVRYILPALAKAMGEQESRLPVASLTEAVDFQPDLTWFLPVKTVTGSDGTLQALPRPTNTSGDFIGLRDTDGFIELPRGRERFPAGFAANLYRW